MQQCRPGCCNFATAPKTRGGDGPGLVRRRYRVSASLFAVRAASAADVPELQAMIRALADYEKLSELCVATNADLADALFGPRPAAEALIAWSYGQAAGFALFFHNFSTCLIRLRLYPVQP